MAIENKARKCTKMVAASAFMASLAPKDTAGVRCGVQTDECTKGSAGKHEHDGY